MFLIYVDESGEVKNSQEKVFVLGAVAVYENQAFFLSQEFDKIQERWFPTAPDAIEFHASDILNGDGEPWHSMSKAKRKELLLELYNPLLTATPKGVSVFGIAIQKDSFQNEDPVEKTFGELCGHVDAFIDGSNLERSKEGKEKSRALVILDSSKYGTRLDRLLLAYRL
jgi:hypothetical protein